MSQRVVSVAQLVRYLKQKMDGDRLIQGLIVQGEISNFTNHRSGHWYFTLKDETSRIACVMFQSYARQCSFLPKNGDRVLLKANTSVFETSGQLQLYGTAMQLDGIGDLYLQFEKLKRKLADEGLFDAARKKKIPRYPVSIALVTGKNTAAREDVVSTLRRRWPLAKISEFHALVQGEEAPEELISALSKADCCGAEVILLVRGGGSIEDLWAFNSEALARKIAALKTPLIAGVGHEVDVTIVDYVADLRAPTPTGAAEMVSPDIHEVKALLAKINAQLVSLEKGKLQTFRRELNLIHNKRVFQQPLSLLDGRWMKLDLLEQQLFSYTGIFSAKRMQFEKTKQRMSYLMQQHLNDTFDHLAVSQRLLREVTSRRIIQTRQEFLRQTALLDAYSPLKSLARGYGLIYHDQRLLTSTDQIEPHELINVVLKDGILEAEILKKENKNHGQGK